MFDIIFWKNTNLESIKKTKILFNKCNNFNGLFIFFSKF